MNKSFTRKLLAACIFGCLATIAIADGPPVKLSIDAPNSNGGLALLSESGWPLTIKMVVDFPEGKDFPAYAVQPNFAIRGRWGAIVFDDPDGCLNPPLPHWLVMQTPECGFNDYTPVDWKGPESDEVYMEFWPDVDMAGVEDNTGNTDLQAILLDSTGSRGPEFQKWNADPCVPGDNDFGTDDSNCIKFGPDTGLEVTDGFGFGADDDITGLVIIAEYGVGRVFDEPDFELSDPIGAVNLAGLVNSVTYDLSDLNKENIKAKGKPTEIITEQARIWAHMNMEPGVLRHLIQYDDCIGAISWSEPAEGDDPPPPYIVSCAGNDEMSIDGGYPEVTPYQNMPKELASVDLLESTTYTLKAFLVSGQAPNRLFDKDGDGDVDSADAVKAGYTLISSEDSITLLQLSLLDCFGGGSGSYYWDIDNNGEAGVILPVCPASAGTISRPPR
jgi:hypothetical protein